MNTTMLGRIFAVLITVGGFSLPMIAEARGGVVIVAPPPPRVEVVPVAPYGGAVWAPGYWEWRRGQHVWVGGHYVRGRAGYDYEPNRWEQRGHHWRMHRGGWHRKHRH